MLSREREEGETGLAGASDEPGAFILCLPPASAVEIILQLAALPTAASTQAAWTHTSLRESFSSLPGLSAKKGLTWTC